MANQTIYPYGTDGQLPSSIGLVNDLKTGGVDKALTAEQGKVIGELLIENVSYDSTQMTSIYSGKQLKADSSQIGKTLGQVQTYNDSNVRNYRIPVSGAYNITYTKYSTSANYGCLFLDGNDVVISGVYSTASDPQRRTIGIPDGAVSFIWSFYPAGQSEENLIAIVSYVKSDAIDSHLDSLDASVDNLNNDVGIIRILQDDFANYDHFKDGYQLKANNDQIGKTLDNVTTTSSTGSYINVKIPIDGYTKVSFVAYTTGYEYGSLILDSNNVVLLGIYATSNTDGRKNIGLPADAAYLVASYYVGPNSTYDKTVILYKDDSIVSRLDTLESKEASSVASGSSPQVVLGIPDSSGAVASSQNYLTTETIFGSFYIELKEGWEVYEGHLYDKGGNIVSYQYINYGHKGINRRSNNRIISIANVVPEYGVRLVFSKTGQAAISEDENNPVLNFVSLNDAGLHRWIPEDLPNYERALRRINYIQSLRWVALAKVPNGYPSSSSTTATNTANTYFDLAGQMAIGVPYSDVAETRKYVPNNVSLRTFMTAVKNRRSLLYTEELHKGVSQYGMTYQQGNRRSYYGEVCSGFTAWVMGNKTLYLSTAYHSDTVPGLSIVNGGNASNVRPLDLLWWDGHVAIVSEILLDEFGNRQYIVIAEMTSPYPFRTIYTPAQFDSRMSSGEIHRWTGWDNLPEVEEARDLSQYVLGDTRQEVEYNPDIACFAGEYAAFAEGDTIYLNARRNSVYTGVELYKDDVLLQTIDITGLSADTIVTPNTEDWVKVNLTTLNLTYGKYKACLTDGTNTTDYTYFEVIDITFTATKSGSTVTAYFSSNSGTPVSLERVKANGFANAYRPLTAEVVEAGQATAWNVASGGYSYLTLLVSGDYGDVHKTISIPTE